MLRTEPEELDADRFERLSVEGRSAGEANDHPRAARRLHQALDLWRGPALADFTYDPFAQAEIARLEELRLDAVVERVEADLALGRAADLVGELEALIRDNPLRERLRGQLMLALYRSGRQADALEAYRQACQDLDEQLGLAPSPPLERLQTAILRQEPALEVSIETPRRPSRRRRRAGTGALRGAQDGDRGDRAPGGRPGPGSRGAQPARTSDTATGVARTVARYGGTVTSSVGGAVIAVFGVPRAHEDDALRAVSAALEIRDSRTRRRDRPRAWRPRRRHRHRRGVGERFRHRQGLGRRGADDRSGGARGGRGRRRDPRSTRRPSGWCAGRARVEQVETEAGRAWGVRDLARERPAVGSLKAPLVGREPELDRLREAFERATREQTLHLFTVLGTAGIGKSRLAQEFATDAAERPRSSSAAACRTARASPSGRCARSSAG